MIRQFIPIGFEFPGGYTWCVDDEKKESHAVYPDGSSKPATESYSGDFLSFALDSVDQEVWLELTRPLVWIDTGLEGQPYVEVYEVFVCTAVIDGVKVARYSNPEKDEMVEVPVSEIRTGRGVFADKNVFDCSK